MAILKVVIKHAMSIVNMRFFTVKDDEFPRLVLVLLKIDSIGALGMIAWVASRPAI